MIYLLVAGLVALLGVLLLVRSAQQHATTSDRTHVTSGAASSDPEPIDRRSSPPSPDTLAPARHASRTIDLDAVDSDFYLWESRRLARRGEARAATLDFFGHLVSGLATLIALGAALAVAASDDTMTTDERLAVAVGAGGSVLALIAIAAMLLGLGALVRNSSRSLSIAAASALNSYEPPDQE